MNTLLQKTNLDIIRQLRNLLETLPPGVYHQGLEALHQHSVGQHTRHIVEFYQCLLNGLAQSKVNYDARERNFRIETDKTYTIQLLDEIGEKLLANATDKPLILQIAFGTNEVQNVPSCFFRELTYLIEHTVHHLAIIKIGLNQCHPTIALPTDFGVAHSTLQYKAQQAASA